MVQLLAWNKSESDIGHLHQIFWSIAGICSQKERIRMEESAHESDS